MTTILGRKIDGDVYLRALDLHKHLTDAIERFEKEPEGESRSRAIRLACALRRDIGKAIDSQK